LKAIGYYWGIGGVLAILLSAVFRLSFRIVEMLSYPLSILQWIVLVAFALYMAYAEGYKGFHLNFSPRVVERARFFLDQSESYRIWHMLFAPIFCMGYIHATRKRKLISFSLTSAIIVLVLLVSMLPQPWRGIVDAGVVLGLLLGILSIAYFWMKSAQSGKTDWNSPVPADFPG
tara:strand:+ start:1225 stop:1746 length:522 start_codon:yes stop_codon:yes gene_type:complete